MAEPSQVETIGDLRTQWRRWTGIVQLVASRQKKRYAVDPDEYHALHSGLLRLARASANWGDAAPRPTVGGLEEILAPWVNLDSLVSADQEIVCNLLDRCRAVQGLLGGRLAARPNWKLAKFVLTAVVLVGAAVVLLAPGIDLVSLPSLNLPPWMRHVTSFVRHGGSSGRLFMLGAGLTSIAFFLVWRSARQS